MGRRGAGAVGRRRVTPRDEWYVRFPLPMREPPTTGDDAVPIDRATLARWAQAVRDEVGLDAIVEEIGAILGGEQ